MKASDIKVGETYDAKDFTGSILLLVDEIGSRRVVGRVVRCKVGWIKHVGSVESITTVSIFGPMTEAEWDERPEVKQEERLRGIVDSLSDYEARRVQEMIIDRLT